VAAFVISAENKIWPNSGALVEANSGRGARSRPVTVIVKREA
jgi:hypothetical protein